MSCPAWDGGLPNSPGHYLDLISAVSGIGLLVTAGLVRFAGRVDRIGKGIRGAPRDALIGDPAIRVATAGPCILGVGRDCHEFDARAVQRGVSATRCTACRTGGRTYSPRPGDDEYRLCSQRLPVWSALGRCEPANVAGIWSRIPDRGGHRAGHGWSAVIGLCRCDPLGSAHGCDTRAVVHASC
jgi:hypothetical protein